MSVSKRFVTKNGLDNNGNSITNLGVSGASVTMAGANALTLTTTGPTNITFPTSGTLATTAGSTTTAINLSGGAAGSVPYQSSANNTAFLAAGTASQVLVSGASSPAWTNTPTLTGTNFSGTANSLTVGASGNLVGGAANSIPYQTGAGTTTFLAQGTGVLQETAGAPVWTTTPTLTGTNFSSIPTAALTGTLFTLGSTGISANGTTTTVAGLTSVTSTTFVGALSGHASLDLALTGGSMTGTITMDGTHTVTGLPTPVAGTDAVTKNYVDAAITGLEWKQSAAAASTANIPNTYANGASGVGATITTTGALTTLDGYTLLVNDRVLIKNQTTQFQNGIYTVTSIAATTVLTRTTDANTTSELNNATLYITNGTTLADTGWTQITPSITIGTTSVVFNQFSGAGTYVAGTGLSLTGNTFANTGVTSFTSNTGLSTNTSASGAVTVTNTGVTSFTSNTGLSTNTSATGAVTVTNTGVTSNVAGAGISVSGATGAVTVTNTGVTSAVAGTNIAVSGATGAVTISVTGTVASATSATNATNTAITDDNATAATVFPTWVTANTGNLPQKTSSTKLTFNPSTGVLTSTSFTGSGAGLTSIPNGALTNSSLTLGSTSMALGSTTTTVAGLTSVTSTTFVGALTGHASLDLALTGGTMSGSLGLGGVAPTTVLDIAAGGGMFRIGSAGGNNLIQAYSSGGTLGLWAGGTSQVYSNTGLTILTGATTSTSSPTGGTNALVFTAAGAATFASTVAATTFTGALSGNATTATTATNATNVATTGGVSTAGTFFLPFVASNGSSNQALNTSGNITFNPNTSFLSVGGTIQSGSGTTGATFQPYTGGAGFSIYSTSATPSGSNYNFYTNSATTYLNGTTTSALLVNGTVIASATGSGLSVTGTSSATSFTGAGTGLTGTAASLSIGGNAATATTATNQSGGTVSATTGTFSGKVTINNGSQGAGSASALYVNGGDITSARASNQGVVYLGTTGNNYIYYDGTNYILGGSGSLNLPGGVSATVGTFSSSITCTTLTASGDVTAFSDIRIKRDIEVIPDALNKVEAIRGVTYMRTDDAYFGEFQTGVIAQEVQKVLPEAVKENEDGMLSVAYGNMVGLLIESIKELSAQNKSLLARIEILEGK